MVTITVANDSRICQGRESRVIESSPNRGSRSEGHQPDLTVSTFRERDTSSRGVFENSRSVAGLSQRPIICIPHP
ncbi:hypothetical protein L596_002459 [Steinernema carpocapsae]|uniref:Uncharacterized protein n=1 Tax=Steinernema carpocapsae TaxID=34508 RepID=A0A4U8UQB7_STECR|nr:hypothetical protein L596_002459 [Steinernema carpocapsae]